MRFNDRDQSSVIPLMYLALLDFESVLVPELWPILGDALGLPELLLTTRQVSDKIELNAIRLRALKKSGVTVAQIEKILEKVEPLPGAGEFLDWLGVQIPFVIVSDCFRPMALPLLKKLGMPTMISHNWQTRGGRVSALPLRTSAKDTKAPVVRTFQKLGFNVFATGDSLNDLGMLRAADTARWFRPSPRALILAPEIKVSKSYTELRKVISKL